MGALFLQNGLISVAPLYVLGGLNSNYITGKIDMEWFAEKKVTIIILPILKNDDKS